MAPLHKSGRSGQRAAGRGTGFDLPAARCSLRSHPLLLDAADVGDDGLDVGVSEPLRLEGVGRLLRRAAVSDEVEELLVGQLLHDWGAEVARTGGVRAVAGDAFLLEDDRAVGVG